MAPFTFQDGTVAGHPVKVMSTRLTNEHRSLTAWGYISLHNPSVVVIAIRPNEDRRDIEAYLAGLQIR